MKFYHYILIGVGALLLIFFILCMISIIKKKNKTKVVKGYYNQIVEAVGGLENILEVSQMGSRLSFMLSDINKIDTDKLHEININGIVKTTKKVTLVVGEMAKIYKESIEKELSMKK